TGRAGWSALVLLAPFGATAPIRGPGSGVSAAAAPGEDEASVMAGSKAGLSFDSEAIGRFGDDLAFSRPDLAWQSGIRRAGIRRDQPGAGCEIAPPEIDGKQRFGAGPRRVGETGGVMNEGAGRLHPPRRIAAA